VPLKNGQHMPLACRHGPEVPPRQVARGHTVTGATVGLGAVKDEHSTVPVGHTGTPGRKPEQGVGVGVGLGQRTGGSTK
jgi:hypothetical protein